MAIPVTFVYKVVNGTALPSLKGMDKTTFAAYVNGTLGDDDWDFGITRTQIQIVGFAIAVTAIHLEVDFQLISWVTKKIQGLAAVTIDTGLIFVGVAMLIIGWPVAGHGNEIHRELYPLQPYILWPPGPRLSVPQVSFGILTSERGLGTRLLQLSRSRNGTIRLMEDEHPAVRDGPRSSNLGRNDVDTLIHDKDHCQQRLGVERPKSSCPAHRGGYIQHDQGVACQCGRDCRRYQSQSRCQGLGVCMCYCIGCDEVCRLLYCCRGFS